MINYGRDIFNKIFLSNVGTCRCLLYIGILKIYYILYDLYFKIKTHYHSGLAYT